VSRSLPALLSLLLVAAPLGHAADRRGSLRLTGRLSVDSNPLRDFSGAQSQAPRPDTVLSLLAVAEGSLTGERAQLVGHYELGGRKFLDQAEEDLLVQAAAAEGSVALGPQWALGMEGRIKDRRGGSRAYSDLGANAFAEYAPDVRLALRVRVGAHRFVYRPSSQANFGGPEVSLQGRYRLNRRHALTVFGEYGARDYGVLATPYPGREDREPLPREDSSLVAGMGYTYRGPLALGLTYTYQELNSNSRGETVRRHRLSGSAGMRLPWRITLLAQGGLGLSSYPDGIFLSPEILLVEEDEAQNSLSLKLARPLSERMDLELSYALYGTRLPQNQLSYFRQVAGLGLTWRL
jgi:hypothetical protein